MTEPIGSSPSADSTPSCDASTVRVSNVTSPDVTVLPDDDPPVSASRHPLLSKQGRVRETSQDISSVDFASLDFLPSTDTYVEPGASTNPSTLDVGTGIRAQIDTGAFATCTDQIGMLHDYRAFDNDKNKCPVRLMPATHGSDAVPHGFGYLHVPSAYTPLGYIPVRAYYHPNLRTTVIDERDFARGAGMKQSDFYGESLEKDLDTGQWTYTFHHRIRKSQDVVVHGLLVLGKAYTLPLLEPDSVTQRSIESALTTDPSFSEECRRATIQNVFVHQEQLLRNLREELHLVPEEYHSLPFHEYIAMATPINVIKASTERMLWHQRLGHPSDHYLYNAHKHVDGVPKFKHQTPVLDECPTCIQAKQRKEPAGPNSTKTATMPYQGLSIDFAFSGTKSDDKSRADDYVGLNGETCYILVVDHASGMYHGCTRVSKATPLQWLETFLKHNSPHCPDKYVYMDQGGELYRNPEARALFKRFKYDLRPTGADSSNQNGPVERAHLNVGNAIRSMLHGANMPIKFWPYAFYMYLRLKNATPSRHQDRSPVEIVTGRRDDFSTFRTFGCRVWIRPPRGRRTKFLPNSRKGLFLGFLPGTTKNILWYDVETQRVKIAKHVRFDEGMNDLPFDAIPPNVQHLMRSQEGKPFPAEITESSIIEFTFLPNPFAATISKTVPIRCSHPTFGILLSVDDLYKRVFVSSIIPTGSFSKAFSTKKAARNKSRGAFIVSINGSPVFTLDHALAAFSEIRNSNDKNFDIELAQERRLSAKALRNAYAEHDLFAPDNLDNDDRGPVINFVGLRAIAALRHPDVDFSDEFVPTPELNVLLNAITSTAVLPEEQSLGHLTRRKLKKLSTWPEWKKNEMDQLTKCTLFGCTESPVHLRRMPLFFALTGNTRSAGMENVALITAVMVLRVPPRPFMLSLRHIVRVSSNQFSGCFMLLQRP
jgi:hypothetical protein